MLSPRPQSYKHGYDDVSECAYHRLGCLDTEMDFGESVTDGWTEGDCPWPPCQCQVVCPRCFLLLYYVPIRLMSQMDVRSHPTFFT